jgi:hypothetical protein
MRGLAYKRHQERRTRRYAFRVLKYVYRYMKWENENDLWANARKWAHAMAKCSAYCCGNPRRFFNEKTIQERRAELKGLEEGE